ncbi:hypothetical protein [Saccharomonospora viridis]|uniref:hypothetical protein n=1 Tax=Saccharomonospora viridis TaxID=1852 RepID=UPI00240A1B06|nr:hypothetical protein [Saccharomonospora viridis]
MTINLDQTEFHPTGTTLRGFTEYELVVVVSLRQLRGTEHDQIIVISYSIPPSMTPVLHRIVVHVNDMTGVEKVFGYRHGQWAGVSAQKYREPAHGQLPEKEFKAKI